jgi:hypothetical protein
MKVKEFLLTGLKFSETNTVTYFTLRHISKELFYILKEISCYSVIYVVMLLML